MNKDSLYIVSVAMMVICLPAIVIMYFYHMDKTAAFSFTLGAALVATGIEEKLYRPGDLLPYFSWLLALSSFIIGITRL